MSVFLVAMSVSLALCLGLLVLAPRLLALIQRSDLSARQTAHLRPTLRLGGIGIVAGLWAVLLNHAQDLHLLLLMLASSLPVFLSGLLEDVGLTQSPKRRLVMAALSSEILIAITGVHIDRSGLVALDLLFATHLFSITFTIFVTVGLIHAFNLVDGVNGMAGTVALTASLGLAAIAYKAGVDDLDLPLTALVGSIVAFLILNYPSGRIFLGDAGAYTVGFILAWLAVFLLAEAPAVSPWALVLIFFWPIADTLLAIWRRILLRAPIGAPDRLHAHHVAMRVIEILILRRKKRHLSNPLATLAAAPLIVPPALAGILFWDDTLSSVVALLGFATLFVAAYRFAIVGAQNLRALSRASGGRPAFLAVRATGATEPRGRGIGK